MSQVTIIVRNALQRAKITASEAARRIGGSPARITEVLAGRRELSTDTAIQLERLLGLDAGQLLHIQLEQKILKTRERAEQIRTFRSFSEMDEADLHEDLSRSMADKFLATFALAKKGVDLGIVDETSG